MNAPRALADAYPAPPAAEEPVPPAPARRRAAPLVQAFVGVLLGCQVALLLPGIGPLRMFVRTAAFGLSLLLLAAVRGRGRRHPAFLPAVLVVGVLLLALASPMTVNLTAGAAQAALYVAVLAPVFWASRLAPDIRAVRQTAMILWVFHSASAALGVLQVYFPGQLQPPISTIILAKGPGYLNSLMITTAAGVRVFRPMGLSDIPGGASVSALYAVLFGTGFFLTRRTPWMMLASAVSMAAGFTCLYLSQVRSVLLMTGIALAVIVSVLAWRRDFSRLVMLAGVAVTVVLGGYTAAMVMAGPTVARRMASLTANRPGAVYYNERGRFFSDAINKTLPEAPFGKGLGHWGMTATYFGRGDDPYATWVEIQWAGWIVDGGAPLVLLYCATLFVSLLAVWNVARKPAPARAPDLPFWGTVVLAHGIGAFALTFSFPLFVSQPGMEFWLLNALLLAAARPPRPPRLSPMVESRVL
ncbi:MAG TPA: hypothetical protein VFJ82_23815 [Longimicrobium sp.]|nr:hypothetical protein [Longimicrobium sp.]